MCIRDSAGAEHHPRLQGHGRRGHAGFAGGLPGRLLHLRDGTAPRAGPVGCLLYTSDAADERSSVDLGGRRIIKKKQRWKHHRDYEDTEVNDRDNPQR